MKLKMCQTLQNSAKPNFSLSAKVVKSNELFLKSINTDTLEIIGKIISLVTCLSLEIFVARLAIIFSLNSSIMTRHNFSSESSCYMKMEQQNLKKLSIRYL